MTDSTPQPWDQQLGETDKQYARFRMYLDLGPGRTYEAAHAALLAGGDKIALSRVRQIAGEHAWIRRAELHDGTARPPAERRFRLAADRDPWDQQPDESERMYSRFRTYLELGRTRTLTNAAEILTSTGDDAKLHGVYIRSLSAQFLWTQRTGAYDREQDRVERERLIEQRRDMIRRHRAIANDLSAKAKNALGKLKVEKITPLDIVRMLRLAAQIEATALGMPFETVAVTGASGAALLVDDLSTYTPQERAERLAEIGREVISRAGIAGDDLTAEDE